MQESHDIALPVPAPTAPARARAAEHEEAQGKVTVRLDPDSEHGVRMTCVIRSNKLKLFKTKKAVWARVPLDELQVTVWPHRSDLFGLASGFEADDIVCCADSEDIRNEWLAFFQRLGIDVATKLGADDELYVLSWFVGVEIHGDALKSRLACTLRRLEEQQARMSDAEHLAVPAHTGSAEWHVWRGRGVCARLHAPADSTHGRPSQGRGVLRVAHHTHQPA